MFELRNKTVSEFKGIINGVEFDREHIYEETCYLLGGEDIMEDIDLGDISEKDFILSLKNYMEHKIYGKDWIMENIIDDLSSENDLVSYIMNY